MPDGSVARDLAKWEVDRTVCKWWQRHPWGPWVEYESVLETRQTGAHLVMKATCQKCGLFKFTKVFK